MNGFHSVGALPHHLRRRRRLPNLLRRVRFRLQPATSDLGAAGSAVWLMALGAFLGSSIEAPDAIGSLQQVAVVGE